MNELAAALQFPDHFGHNGAALRDCLGDLSWHEQISHFIVLVRNAELFLADESQSEARSLVALLAEQAATLPQPDLAGWPAGSMPARTIHWLFVCDPNLAQVHASRLGIRSVL